MAKTQVEKNRDYRLRQREEIRALKEENAQLRAELELAHRRVVAAEAVKEALQAVFTPPAHYHVTQNQSAEREGQSSPPAAAA
jgi:uncharacterized membrane protein (UPF0182 family)